MTDTIKVYKLEIYGEGWCVFQHTESLREDLEVESDERGVTLDVGKAMETISALSPGEKWEHDGIIVTCLTMTRDEFENLTEFDGW